MASPWRPSRPLLFLLLQLLVLLGAWVLLQGRGSCRGAAQLLPTWGGGSGAAAPAAADGQPAAGAVLPRTSNITEWVAAPDSLAFLAPQSRCLFDPRGAVELPPGRTNTSLPFLLDRSAWPPRGAACAHCPRDKYPAVPYCCGVCQFAGRTCESFYPRQDRAAIVARFLQGSGYPLQDFSPCELYGRIRGRTLWVMGDSQMWNLYYALECALAEFAPDLRRRPAILPEAENDKLISVVHPVPYPPLCLGLAGGTRVCVVRVDAVRDLRELVFPALAARSPGFSRDIVVFNFGLHYAKPGFHGEPVPQSMLWLALSSIATMREQQPGTLPRMLWIDTPPQHFNTPDGSYPGGGGPFTCAPIKSYNDGNATALAGGPYNAPIAPLLHRIADAQVKIWHATVPLWGSHWQDECTHWCHPTAYQLWVHLINDALRQHAIGAPVWVPERY